MSKTLLTYQELSEHLNIKISTLYALVCRKRIPHIRLSPRFVRFDANEINEWLTQRKVDSVETAQK
jgi:excisionase family DNA binding protein